MHTLLFKIEPGNITYRRRKTNLTRCETSKETKGDRKEVEKKGIYGREVLLVIFLELIGILRYLWHRLFSVLFDDF